MESGELIELGRFQALVLGGAAVVTVAGLALAAAWRPRDPRGLARGLFVAALGPLLAGGWFGFNAVVAALGLDSVAALGINLAAALALGLGLGLAARRLWGAARGDKVKAKSSG